MEIYGETIPNAAFVDISAQASTASGGGTQTSGHISEGVNGIGIGIGIGIVKDGFED